MNSGVTLLVVRAFIQCLSQTSNLFTQGTDLIFQDNPTLPTCAVEALRDAIGTDNIGGSVSISGNYNDATCP